MAGGGGGGGTVTVHCTRPAGVCHRHNTLTRMYVCINVPIVDYICQSQRRAAVDCSGFSHNVLEM